MMVNSSKNFYIEKNWISFFRYCYKLFPNFPCAIQSGRLYNKFTHLTLQWYTHLIFGRFYKMQLSHINCQGYREVKHIKTCKLSILITMNSIQWNLSFLDLICLKFLWNFKIFDIIKCLNKWNVHISNIWTPET